MMSLEERLKKLSGKHSKEVRSLLDRELRKLSIKKACARNKKERAEIAKQEEAIQAIRKRFSGGVERATAMPETIEHAIMKY